MDQVSGDSEGAIHPHADGFPEGGRATESQSSQRVRYMYQRSPPQGQDTATAKWQVGVSLLDEMFVECEPTVFQ